MLPLQTYIMLHFDMRKRAQYGIALAITLALVAVAKETAVFSLPGTVLPESTAPELPPWQPGYLDIHQMSVDSDAAYLVFPDGTTMLIDAGETDKAAFEKKVAPLKAAARRPAPSKRSGEQYAAYIKNVEPPVSKGKIDYALISHFHGDHYGNLTDKSPVSAKGAYRLTGMTDVAEALEIGTLIDRGYPAYDFPVDMKARAEDNPTFANYLKFVASREARGLLTQKLVAGSNGQIRLLHDADTYPGFEVRNMKANATIWNGSGSATKQLFEPSVMMDEHGGFNENPLSLAIKISYGAFDFFTGGDMTGGIGPDFPAWFDTETPLAPIVGEVDVFGLNHHGVRDANNRTFLAALMPQTIIIRGRTSDHPGQEVAHAVISETLYPGERNIFSISCTRKPKSHMGHGSWKS